MFQTFFSVFVMKSKGARISARTDVKKLVPEKMASKFNFHMGGHSPSLTTSNQSTPNGPDDDTAFNYPPVGSVSFRKLTNFLVWSGSILNFWFFFPVRVWLWLEQLLRGDDNELWEETDKWPQKQQLLRLELRNGFRIPDQNLRKSSVWTGSSTAEIWSSKLCRCHGYGWIRDPASQSR